MNYSPTLYRWWHPLCLCLVHMFYKPNLNCAAWLTDAVLLCQQSDVVHQSVFDLIHTDDRSTFREQLHFALNPPAAADEDGECFSSKRVHASTSLLQKSYQITFLPLRRKRPIRYHCCRLPPGWCGWCGTQVSDAITQERGSVHVSNRYHRCSC